VYHHEDSEGVHVDEEAASMHKTETERRTADLSDSDSNSTHDVENEKDEVASPIERQETTIQEIRGGIPDEHDVEANPPALEKKKSSRSIKDPNLVCYFVTAPRQKVEGF
jgi:hypothetical protein